MTKTEIMRLRKFLNDRFNSTKFELKNPSNTDDGIEVYLEGEFIGTIYRDDDEGEISFDFNMSILEMDLPNAADASII
jgi:hypothetical protein